MPSMHTHSCELRGEGEGTTWTCTDKITKSLQRGWELNLLPLQVTSPQDHLCFCPQELSHTITDRPQEPADWGKSIWLFRSPLGDLQGQEFSVPLCDAAKRGETPTISHRAAILSQYANPTCTPVPARNLSVSRLHVSFIKK